MLTILGSVRVFCLIFAPLWIMKGSYFGFGSPYRLTCMQGQKTLSLSYIMHLFTLFAQRFPNHFSSAINFSKPLLCVTLICDDWSDDPVCCDWSTACSACQKWNAHHHYWITVHYWIFKCWRFYMMYEQTTWLQFYLINSSPEPQVQQVGGQYANVSCWRQHETAWDSF